MRRRGLRVALVATVVVGLAIRIGVAAASQGRLELADGGDRVVVTLRGATLASTTIEAQRERLEVELSSGATDATLRSPDPTVKQVDVRGRSRRMLSVKLRAGRAGVLALAALARVEQVGDEIRMTVPRAAPIAPSPPAAVAAASPLPAPVPPAETVPVAGEPALPTPGAGDAAAPSQPATTVNSDGATTSPPVPAAARVQAVGRPSPGGGLGAISIAAMAMVAAAALIWTAWRRRRARPSETSIEMIASRALGPKARVVWLAAGDRELVLAVSPQNVRLLSQWRRGGADRDEASSVRQAPGGEHPTDSAALPAARLTTASPVLSGLLRLREQRPSKAQDVPGDRRRRSELVGADDDGVAGAAEEDALWARELLAATRGHR